jgi:transposase
MSNPFLNRAIANVHAKNDKYDARILAHLTRTNLIATCYVPGKSIRFLRELIAQRAKFVRMSTQLKNKIHLLLCKYNYKSQYQYIFGPNGKKWMENSPLPDGLAGLLEDNLSLLNVFEKISKDYYDKIKSRIIHHPYYQLLKTVPGISIIHGASIISRIDDIKRFQRVGSFIRYAGLSINTRESADKLHLGHINRKSDKHLRTAFIEAAHSTIKKDPGLCSFYDYLRKQKGHGCAIVAVARKLARSAYFMLIKGTDYKFRRVQRQWLDKNQLVTGSVAS